MDTEEFTTPTTDRTATALRIILTAVIAIAAIFIAWVAYAYAFSAPAIRHPQTTHYHFRLQVINNGQVVNFADPAFQTAFNTDICTAALTKEPVHFHDGLDQFVHIHWAHVTGGLLLKDYGWNFAGGPDDTLGYRFDQLPRLARIPIHGHALPAPARDAHYYIYTGSASSYQERNWKDFLAFDLRDFFAGKRASAGYLESLAPAAHAATDEEKFARLNDVIGSVVIFAQKDKPTDQQVKYRFDHLVPLPESACSG